MPVTTSGHITGKASEKPARKGVTPTATDTKPADQTNQIGGPKPHSSQKSPELSSEYRIGMRREVKLCSHAIDLSNAEVSGVVVALAYVLRAPLLISAPTRFGTRHGAAPTRSVFVALSLIVSGICVRMLRNRADGDQDRESQIIATH